MNLSLLLEPTKTKIGLFLFLLLLVPVSVMGSNLVRQISQYHYVPEILTKILLFLFDFVYIFGYIILFPLPIWFIPTTNRTFWNYGEWWNTPTLLSTCLLLIVWIPVLYLASCALLELYAAITTRRS